MPKDALMVQEYPVQNSRYKVARPLRSKRAKDVADMIANIYKVGPLTCPKVFQSDNGSEFKAEVTKMLEKHEVMTRHMTMKYKHTHTAFVKASGRGAVQGTRCTRVECPKKVSSTLVKHPYGLVDKLNNTEAQRTGMKSKGAIK